METRLRKPDFVANLLSVSERELQHMVRRGQVEYRRLPNGQIRFTRDDIQRLIERCKVPA